MKNYRLLKAILTPISIICSFTLMGYFAFLSTRPIYWFIPLSVYFLYEGVFTILSISKKDPYDGMRVQGIFQVISVFIVTSYLLAMILWDDFNETMVYLPTFLLLGIIIVIKLITAVINYVFIKIKYEPMLHAMRNSDFITIFYLIVLIVSTIINKQFPGTGVGLLYEKPVPVYILFISVNAFSMIFASLLALSTDIRSKTKEPLSTFGKVKHFFRWFGDNEVTMFFSFIFTFYLMFIALLNVKTSIFYIFVAIYYFIFTFIRFINYLWHRGILEKTKGNIIQENRKSSFILLFNAFFYTVSIDLLIVGAYFLMLNKTQVDTNLNLLLFILIPFCIFKFVLAFINIKNHSRGNNTYRVGLAYMALINAFFSLIEIIAILTHLLPSSVIPLRLTIISICLVATKIIVMVMVIIFIVYFFRSIIINRKKKEKLLKQEQLNKQKESAVE